MFKYYSRNADLWFWRGIMEFLNLPSDCPSQKLSQRLSSCFFASFKVNKTFIVSNKYKHHQCLSFIQNCQRFPKLKGIFKDLSCWQEHFIILFDIRNGIWCFLHSVKDYFLWKSFLGMVRIYCFFEKLSGLLFFYALDLRIRVGSTKLNILADKSLIFFAN